MTATARAFKLIVHGVDSNTLSMLCSQFKGNVTRERRFLQLTRLIKGYELNPLCAVNSIKVVITYQHFPQDKQITQHVNSTFHINRQSIC